MQLPTSLVVAAVALSLSSVASAVCAGHDLAIGTANVLASGKTQWKIYSTSCAVRNIYAQSSAVTLCDSQVFNCNFGTTTIGQYDDPVTGWAYNSTADPVTEACGTDIIVNCGSAYWGQQGDGNPLQS